MFSDYEESVIRIILGKWDNVEGILSISHNDIVLAQALSSLLWVKNKDFICDDFYHNIKILIGNSKSIDNYRYHILESLKFVDKHVRVILLANRIVEELEFKE